MQRLRLEDTETGKHRLGGHRLEDTESDTETDTETRGHRDKHWRTQSPRDTETGGTE